MTNSATSFLYRDDSGVSFPSWPLTAGDPPAGDPAVVSRAEAGLLARQAGVADEVRRVDVCGRFHQRDVVVQLAVGGISETLVPVDSLHRENPLYCLGTLQLMLPQDDPPAPSILCFTSGSPEHGSVRHLCGLSLVFLWNHLIICARGSVYLLLEAVSSSKDPVLVDQSSTTDMDEMFTSPGTNLWERTANIYFQLPVYVGFNYQII